jgi:hypothetical protein
MKRILFVLLVLGAALSANAQHALQMDDGAGRYGILLSNPTWPIGTTVFDLPPTGGTLIVAPPFGSPALVWLTAGNTVAPGDVFGSINGQDVVMIANNVERMRLHAGGVFAATTNADINVNGVYVGGMGALQSTRVGNQPTTGVATNSTTIGFWANTDNFANNTAVGVNALRNTGGGVASQFNTAIGETAGQLSAGTGGDYNTYLGYGAIPTAAITNSTAIGNGAQVGASNLVRLGNASVTRVSTSGSLSIRDVAYVWPAADGAGVLVSNGALGLSWNNSPTLASLTLTGNLIVGGTSDLRGAISNSTGDVTISDNMTFTTGMLRNNILINPLDQASTGIGTNGLLWLINSNGYAASISNGDGVSATANGLLVKIGGTAATNRIFTAASLLPLGAAGGGHDKFIIFGNGTVQMPTYTTNGIIHATGGNGTLTSSLIVNADVDAAAAVAYSKLASMPTGNFLIGNGGTPTSTLMSGDATVNATGVIDISNNAVTNDEFRQGIARSVVGVTGNATANVADIQGTTDQVLRVDGTGTSLAFGQVATGGIADDAVTNAKIRNSTGLSVIGRSTNSAGDPADIIAATANHVLRLDGAGTTLGFGTVAPAGITAGGNNTFLTTNNVGVVGWLGFNRNGTLVGDGITTALGINVANSNIWTADQLLPNTAAQGTNLATAINTSPTLIDDNNIAATIARDNESPAAGDVTGSLSAGYSVTNVQNGAVSLTTDVTGILPVANGGTGVNASTITNGQILIGHDLNNNFSVANITAGSGISVTNGAGTITIAATGGASTAYLTWSGNTRDNNWSTSSTEFSSLHGTQNPSTTQADHEIVIPIACTITAIYVTLDGTPNNGGGTQSYVFDIVKNGGGDSDNLTISEGSSSGSLTGISFAVSAGDRLAFRCDPDNSPNGRQGYWGILATVP